MKATQAGKKPANDHKHEVKDMPKRHCMVCGKETLGWGTFRAGVVCGKEHNEQYMRQRYERKA